MTVAVEGVDGATAGTTQTLTCSVSGVDLAVTSVTSVMYVWLRGNSVVQAASTSNQYTIPSQSLGVRNAGDEYTCQVAITANYWDVSESFGGSGSGTLTVISKSNGGHTSLCYSCLSFNNPVPNPIVQITEIPLIPTEYVGLNFTWRCDARIPDNQFIGVDAAVEWMKLGVKLSSSNDGRITLGDLVIDSPGREYRRSINFSPLSADDMGTYSCSATFRPTMPNSDVTNSFGISNNSLNIIGKI